MGKIEGTAAAEVNAPVERCYEVAADVDHWGEWQRGVQRIEVLDRDGEGRVARARIINQTKVREITTELRFSYQPTRGLSWTQTGAWSLAFSRPRWALSTPDATSRSASSGESRA